MDVDKLEFMSKKYDQKKMRKWVNFPDENHNCPIHYAARSSNIKIMEQLEKMEAEITKLGNNRMSPLHFVIRYDYINSSCCLV